jgi:hypothetical protein
VEDRSFVVVITTSISIILELACELICIEHSWIVDLPSAEFVLYHISNFLGLGLLNTEKGCVKHGQLTFKVHNELLIECARTIEISVNDRNLRV